jgi:hypothetical protein
VEIIEDILVNISSHSLKIKDLGVALEIIVVSIIYYIFSKILNSYTTQTMAVLYLYLPRLLSMCDDRGNY